MANDPWDETDTPSTVPSDQPPEPEDTPPNPWDDTSPPPVQITPDMSDAQRYIQRNLENFHAPMVIPADPNSASGTIPGPQPTNLEPGSPKKANSIFDSIEAGLQMSVAGLVVRGKTPDMVMSDHPDTFMNIAYQAGQFVGDIPAMGAGAEWGALGGAAAGGAAGSAVPVVGNVVGAAVGGFAGAWGGAFAMPTFLRHVLTDTYNRGEIKTGKEFLEHVGSTLLDTSKSFATGVITGPFGKLAGAAGTMATGLAAKGGIIGIEAAAKVAPAISTIAEKTGEVAAMTTVAAGLDGHLPNAQEFEEGALFIAGLTAISHAAPPSMNALKGASKKLMDIYAKTGVRPEQVVEHAITEPTVAQEILSNREGLPRAYESIQLNDGTYLPPHTQGELYLPMNKQPNIQTVERPAYKQARLDAAKKLDPMAFKALDAMEKDLIKLNEQMQQATKKVTNAEREAAYRLEEIKTELNKGDIPIFAQKALAEEEIAIREKHGGGVIEKVKSADDTIAEINRQATRIQENKTVKERVSQAYQDASKHIQAPEREQVIVLRDDSYLRQEGPGMSREFDFPENSEQILDPNKVEILREEQLQMPWMEATVDHPSYKELMLKDPTVEKPVDLTPSNITVEEKSILSNIGVPAEEAKADPFFSKRTKDNFRRDIIDQFHFIEVEKQKIAPGETLDISQDPYILLHKAATYSGKVEGALRFGIRDFNDVTQKKTRGFWEIVGTDRTEYDKLKAYMMSKRGLEIIQKGMNPGKKFDPEAAKKVVEAGQWTYESKAKELVDFQNQMTGYLKDAGFLSKEQYDYILERNKEYLPWFRNDPNATEKAQGKRSKSNPIKAMKGSEKEIHDPFISIMKNVDLYYRLAEQQRAVNSLIDLNMKGPEEFKYERVDVKQDVPSETSEQISQNMREKKVVKSGDSYVLTRMKDGVKEQYAVPKDVYDAFEKLGGDAVASNVIMNFSRGITKMKRAAITLNPAYMASNLIRDYQASAVFSKYGNLPIENLLNAAKIIKDPKIREEYELYLHSGGAHATFMELDQKYVAREIDKLSKETGLKDLTWNALRNGVDKLAGLAELGEEATRFAEFMRHIEDKGITNEAVQEGGWASREITVDFSRVGAKMRLLRGATAFQGAQIQGGDRFYRAMKEGVTESVDAYKSGGDIVVPSIVKRAFWTATVPSMIAWAVGYGNKDIEDSADYVKNLFWQIPTYKGGPILRIPKSQEVGLVFGSSIERVLDAVFKDNPKYGDQFAKEVLSTFAPTIIPDVIQPGVEAYMNKSFFTKNKLIPAHLEGLMPDRIYTPYTSEVAKAISSLTNRVTGNMVDSPVNPIVVDNWIKSWTGTLGRWALNASDAALVNSGVVPDNGRSPWQVEDLPMIQSFLVRHPSMGAQPVQDFYKLSSDAKRVMDSFKAAEKMGDETAMTKIVEENQVLFSLSPAFEDAKKAINTMSTTIRNTNMDPNMSRTDKLGTQSDTYYQMIEISKEMIRRYDEQKSQGKTVLP